MTFLKLLEGAQIPSEAAHTLRSFYQTYVDAATQNGYSKEHAEKILKEFLSLLQQQQKHPHAFDYFHQSIRKPYDYYAFGIEFTRPLVQLEESKILHRKNLDQIEAQLAKGENVILLANHQTELDPQAISLVLEKTHKKIGEELICVAGHRVTSDPLAVPFSMGCNLLCIYSKKYIEDDLEKKADKITHNQRTMKRMQQLLSEGGKCIYVAPSGGRDRPGADGRVEVAPFDPQSIEMFWLMAKQAEKKTHFYPFALSTYHLLPPPGYVEKQLGEQRVTRATPVNLAFGAEIDMENFLGSEGAEKKTKRQLRAQYIWDQVNSDYQQIET